MKESKATPVIGQTPVQVVPSPNFVHGFIRNELFQDEGRCLPTDAFQLKETAVEPRLEQMQHVTIDCPEVRMVRQYAAKILTHRHNRGSTIRSHVQHSEEFLTRGLGGNFESPYGIRIGSALIRSDRVIQAFGVRHEVGQQMLEELKAVAA